MQTDKKDINDLDYLAERGFEQVAVSDTDLSDLKRRISTRTASFRGIYFSIGSLIIGMILGGFVFYAFYGTEEKTAAALPADFTKADETNTQAAQTVITLDTVSVVKENFINPAKENAAPHVKRENEVRKIDSVDLIQSKPFDLTALSNESLREGKLKYIINSPVFYLHDMKVTNYTTLYFKKNRFVKFTGLTAAYSTTAEALPAGSGLKQQPEYYLHEELANAMLKIKNGKYDEAILSLKTVSEFNKNDPNCEFYLGLCYFYKHNYSRALEFFEANLSNANNAFLQESSFYKALALYEDGQKAEAKLLFRSIVAEHEFYAEKAKRYLEE